MADFRAVQKEAKEEDYKRRQPLLENESGGSTGGTCGTAVYIRCFRRLGHPATSPDMSTVPTGQWVLSFSSSLLQENFTLGLGFAQENQQLKVFFSQGRGLSPPRAHRFQPKPPNL
jgi:hypothetical protein